MLDGYCHVRLEPKKRAVDLLERKPKTRKASEDLRFNGNPHVTNAPMKNYPRLIESVMGATGIKPMTSTVSILESEDDDE
jgi:hypothetical protein